MVVTLFKVHFNDNFYNYVTITHKIYEKETWQILTVVELKSQHQLHVDDTCSYTDFLYCTLAADTNLDFLCGI